MSFGKYIYSYNQHPSQDIKHSITLESSFLLFCHQLLQETTDLIFNIID